MTESTIGLGIIGCGRIAASAVAPAIGWAKNARLVSVASRDPETAKAKAAAAGAATSHGSYEALVEDPAIDAVYIGLPNALHARWIRRALESGKHVLCEKSLTENVEDARALAAVAKERGLRLVEAFMYRHHPQWNLVRRLLAEGAIGEVRALRAWLAGVMAEDDHRLVEGGGGALWDVTCYGVNAARFLLDREPRAASAMAAWKGDADLQSCATLAFPGDDAAPSGGSGHERRGGVLAMVWGSLASATEQGVVVSGVRGRIEIARPFMPGWDETEIILVRDGARTAIRAGGANHYLHMVEHFADLVLDASLPLTSAEDGARNVAACDAIQRSARTGRWELLPNER
jgi:predicted dehydrogenase